MWLVIWSYGSHLLHLKWEVWFCRSSIDLYFCHCYQDIGFSLEYTNESGEKTVSWAMLVFTKHSKSRWSYFVLFMLQHLLKLACLLPFSTPFFPFLFLWLDWFFWFTLGMDGDSWYYPIVVTNLIKWAAASIAKHSFIVLLNLNVISHLMPLLFSGKLLYGPGGELQTSLG